MTSAPAMTDNRADTVNEQRFRLFRQQRGACATCGRIHRRHEDMAMAHRVAETRTNIKVYGFNRVDHDLNKRLVCRETHAGKDCNSSQNLANRPVAAEKLMGEIARVIGEVATVSAPSVEDMPRGTFAWRGK
jgi:hypothetical protein